MAIQTAEFEDNHYSLTRHHKLFSFILNETLNLRTDDKIHCCSFRWTNV